MAQTVSTTGGNKRQSKIRYLCGCELFILSRSLQASLNSWIHIINIEQLAESRGWTRSSGVFQ